MRVSKFGWIGAAVVLSSCIAVGAMAQDAAGQPPAGGGQRRGGGQGRGGFGQGRFGARGGQLLLVNLPVNFLVKELKLTDEQKTAVTEVQTKYRADMQALRQQPADGSQPDFRAIGAKVTELGQKSSKDIDAILKDDQKTEATALVKDLQMLQVLRIPYQTLDDLKLTSEQKTKLMAIAADVTKERTAKQQEIQAARQANDNAKAQELQQAFFASLGAGKPDEKALAVLTADQKDVIDKWQKANPQRGGGRRFGPGAGAAAAAPAP